MRALQLLIYLTAIIGCLGCSEENVTNVTSNPPDTIPVFAICLPEEPTQNPRTCIPEDKTSHYSDLWKQEFMARNGISEDYFDEHISSIWTSSTCTSSATSLYVHYRITIDWAAIDRADKLVIMLSSSVVEYAYLNIPRDVYLDDYQVGRVLDHDVFDSSVGPVAPLDSLPYEDCMEAVEAFQDSVGSGDIVPVRFAYYVPGKIPREDGYPYFIGRGVVDLNSNECITGYFNLFTGEGEARPTPCEIE